MKPAFFTVRHATAALLLGAFTVSAYLPPTDGRNDLSLHIEGFDETPANDPKDRSLHVRKVKSPLPSPLPSPPPTTGRKRWRAR